MELTAQMKETLVTSLKAQRDEIDQLIKCLQGTEGIALVPATAVSGPSLPAVDIRLPQTQTTLRPIPLKRRYVKQKKERILGRGKKSVGRPRAPRRVIDSDDAGFGRCSIDAVAAILRSGVDGSHELTPADIMSALKHRWKIETTFRGVSIVLGRGKSNGRFERVGDDWRLVE